MSIDPKDTKRLRARLWKRQKVAALKADPKAWAEYQAKQKAYQKAYRQKPKNKKRKNELYFEWYHKNGGRERQQVSNRLPERRAKLIERAKDRWKRIKADPVLHEKFLKGQKIREKRYRDKKKKLGATIKGE